MPSALLAPVNVGQIKACVFRIAKLAPDCSPLGGDCSAYVGAGIVNYTAEPEVTDGIEYSPVSGCGDILYTVSDPDRVTSWNLSGEIGVWDSEMLTLMFGGFPILGGSGPFAGAVRGWSSPGPDEVNDGVYFEVIARQVGQGAGDCVAPGAGYPPWVGDIWGKVKFTMGTITRNNDDPYLVNFTGTATGNPSLFDGPWDDYNGVTNGSPYIPNTAYNQYGYEQEEYEAILAAVDAGCQDLPVAS